MKDRNHDEWTGRLPDGRTVKYSYDGLPGRSWARAEIEGEAPLSVSNVLPGYLDRSGVETLFADIIRQKVLN